ncbi:alpha/beta hydrolase [Hyphobacterium sp.]|uniref:alpha/beta hydrolase n=1 Tax=Hyphobacterium sp. TaxID=2004662 RepID=UPI00374A7D9D
MLRRLAAFLLIAIFPAGPALAGDVRTGSFVFSAWSGPAMNVFFVEPLPDAMDGAPVVIVLHGVNRNADDYAANWVTLAREYGLRIYAPEFSVDSFPGAALYNLGGIGTDGPYAYSAIEPLFDAIMQRGGEAEGYVLFGHSAGAQFVHRALLFEDLPRLNTAYPANAGWYTLPDAGTPWPYGLQGTPADQSDVRRWLGRPMVLLLGDQDTDAEDVNLRRTPEAMVQGPHRYARGEYFFAVAQAQANQSGAPFSWHIVSVPGIAHDNAGMAEAAAALIAAQPDRIRAVP